MGPGEHFTNIFSKAYITVIPVLPVVQRRKKLPYQKNKITCPHGAKGDNDA
jgi:hypothetical protein